MVVKRTENEALWVNVRPDDPDICDYLENCLLPNSLYIIDPNLYWMITFLRTSELEKATRPLVHYELPSHHIPVSLFTHRRADKKMLRNHYHNYVNIVRYLPNT